MGVFVPPCARHRREHLLTDAPTQLASSSLIVVKGLLNEETQDSVVEGGGSAERRLPREWMLAVSRKEGTIVRFVAGGVDLIEPGGGESILQAWWVCACAVVGTGEMLIMTTVAEVCSFGSCVPRRFLPVSLGSEYELLIPPPWSPRSSAQCCRCE